MNSVLICSAGTPPQKELLEREKSKCDEVVACDGAVNYLRTMEVMPSYVVGDFDSADREVLAWCQNNGVAMRKAPREKDDTDTMLAVRWAVEHQAQNITVVGGTGGRLDHFYANLLMLNFCSEQGVYCTLVDDQNRIFAPSEGEVHLQKDGYTYLSLFPFQGRPVVFAESGFKYPLKHLELKYDHPIGVSNEMLEQQAVLQIHGGRVLIIQSNDGATAQGYITRDVRGGRER